MACMQCGSDEVANYQYCSACLEARKNARNQTRQEAYTLFRKEDSKFDQAIADPRTWIAAGVFGYLLVFAIFLFGSTGRLGVLASFLFATIAMGIFVAALTGWLIRVKRVVGNSELSGYKLYYVLNITAVVITVLSCVGLSLHLDVSFSEARAMVEGAIFNREVDDPSLSDPTDSYLGGHDYYPGEGE